MMMNCWGCKAEKPDLVMFSCRFCRFPICGKCKTRNLSWCGKCPGTQPMANRGFSPVIAVVLMVAVAVAAAVVAYLWGIGLLSGIISGTSAHEITGQSAIRIENVDPASNQLYLRCMGDPTTITTLYLHVSPGASSKHDLNSFECASGSRNLLVIDTDANSSPNVDINAGHVLRVVGSNNAEALKGV